MKRKVGILGTGSWVPEKILTNAMLEKMVDTSDEWIKTRTGIVERRIAADNVFTSDLATAAAEIAIKQAAVDRRDIPLIIVATFTPDSPLPAVACRIQAKLKIKNAVAIDINGACSGFIYAVEMARQFISSGKYNHALVIGAEELSRVTNWKDRNTCVLFGDGAGAVVLGPVSRGDGIMDTYMGTAGEYEKLLYIPKEKDELRSQCIRMEGRDVFKQAVTVMCKSVQEIVKQCGLKIKDIDYVVPHQANVRIINALMHKLGLAQEKVYVNVDRYGNMSAASIPVALDEALRQGIIKKGNRIVMVAFGAGFSWGANVVQM